MISAVLGRIVLLASLFVSGIWAQSDSVAQCEPGYEWNRNSLDQDPCTIGSMLDGSCRNLTVFNYQSLNDNETPYYLPPLTGDSGGLNCDCNTVMYYLIMACTSCQGGEVDLSWIAWRTDCEDVYLGEYPIDIPRGTAIPHWALYNDTSLTDPMYNETTMKNIGRDPEESQIIISVTRGPTGTGYPGIASPSPSSAKSSADEPSPSPTADSSNDTKGGTNVGAVVGGVIGSVVLLTILAVAGLFCMRRFRQQKAQQQVQNPVELDPQHEKLLPLVHLYNPSDPSTFPPNLPSPVTHTTPISSMRSSYSGVPAL